MKPENIIWVFGSERTGSTWLGRMMGEFGAVWNEPLVGLMFGDFYRKRRDHAVQRPADYIFGGPREAWLASIRRFVLDQADARFPRARLLTIKEPNGSIGAPILMEALPESSMVVLVRDPRDAVASSVAAHQRGGWLYETTPRERRSRWGADEDPDLFVKQRAKYFATNLESSLEAYRSHTGPKALLRYEDLRLAPTGSLVDLLSALGVGVAEDVVRRAAEKHAWENISEEKKGPGKFNRKALPGSWREDLTAEQARTVENVCRPILETFYF